LRPCLPAGRRSGTLGTARDRLKKTDEAAGHYEEALAGFRKQLPPGHVMITNAARPLGLLYYAQKKPAEAVARLAEALKGYADRPDDPQREVCQSFLGLSLCELEKWKEAEPHLTAAYKALSGRPTLTDPEKGRLRQVVQALAAVCEKTDRATNAAEWRERLKAVK
jgi:tetratricopeptide (TPR) repeat protein